MLGAEFYLGQVWVIVDERRHLVVVDGLVAHHLTHFEQQDAVHVGGATCVGIVMRGGDENPYNFPGSLVQRRHVVRPQDDQAVGIS